MSFFGRNLGAAEFISFFSVKDAAEVTHIPYRRLLRMVRDDRVPVYMLGNTGKKHRYVRLEDIERALKTRLVRQ